MNNAKKKTFQQILRNLGNMSGTRALNLNFNNIYQNYEENKGLQWRELQELLTER